MNIFAAKTKYSQCFDAKSKHVNVLTAQITIVVKYSLTEMLVRVKTCIIFFFLLDLSSGGSPEWTATNHQHYSQWATTTEPLPPPATALIENYFSIKMLYPCISNLAVAG